MFNFQLKSAAKVRTFPHIHKQFVCFNTLRLHHTVPVAIYCEYTILGIN